MSSSKTHWLHFLGAVAVCMVVTSAMEAQCAVCIQPPGERRQCGNTFYDGANGCVVSATGCTELGSCEGQFNCEVTCPVEKWACGRPLGEEWRLESYTVELPVARPVPVAGKTANGKV